MTFDAYMLQVMKGAVGNDEPPEIANLRNRYDAGTLATEAEIKEAARSIELPEESLRFILGSKGTGFTAKARHGRLASTICAHAKTALEAVADLLGLLSVFEPEDGEKDGITKLVALLTPLAKVKVPENSQSLAGSGLVVEELRGVRRRQASAIMQLIAGGGTPPRPAVNTTVNPAATLLSELAKEGLGKDDAG